jgi:hypothetical protein
MIFKDRMGYPYGISHHPICNDFFIHLFTCAYTVGPFLLLPLIPFLPSIPLFLPGRAYSALFSNFVEEKT